MKCHGTLAVALYYADRRMDTARIIVARCNCVAIELSFFFFPPLHPPKKDGVGGFHVAQYWVRICCETGSEYSGCCKRGVFLDEANRYNLAHECPALWSWRVV